MAVHEFVSKLKADGSDNDECDLDKVLADYKQISAKLSLKDRGTFSLNVLCILCRNLDKVPSWCQSVSYRSLLTLAVECARQAATLEKSDRVKTLACVYHIHKHAVKQTTSIPAELVLKLSYVPFDCNENTILTEYCKTYWNILVDRLTYIEKLKANKMAIVKLLPKLTEDLIKVISTYDLVQFCNTALVFLVKKLSYLYSDRCSEELNECHRRIHDALSNGLNVFEKLKERETMELYVKLLESFYVVADNSAKNSFKDSILYMVGKTYAQMVGHSKCLSHCFQSFILNTLCNVLNDNITSNLLETTFSSLLLSCETSEELGYKKAMIVTYPHFNQLIRLLIEYLTSNEKKFWKNFTMDAQKSCLKLILTLLEKLKNTNQVLKCENCDIKSGLHDALRLSFAVKHFVTLNVNHKIDVTQILENYTEIVVKQHEVIAELKKLGCTNIDKCFRKAQTDVHNTAILLNKSLIYKTSIELFNMYLRQEIRNNNNESDLKNISRGFYNKSICEVDSNDYENSLKSAYLSIVFGYPECLKSDKNMSLVIDIKSKWLKSAPDDDNVEKEQMLTLMDISKILAEEKSYGDLTKFFKRISYDSCLHHEVSAYLRLWPSLAPVVGGLTAQLRMVRDKQPDWLTVDTTSSIKHLCESIIVSTSRLLSIRGESFVQIVNDTKDLLVKNKDMSSVVSLATLSALHVELKFQEAAEKYGWRANNQNADWYDACATRTLEQEYEAVKYCAETVTAWNKVAQFGDQLKQCTYLPEALHILQIVSIRLLTVRVEACALQCAVIACNIADIIGHGQIYLTSACTLLEYTNKQTDEITRLLRRASVYVCTLSGDEHSGLQAKYAAEAALWSLRTGKLSSAVKLMLYSQTTLLNAMKKEDNADLDLAICRLMEACLSLSKLNKDQSEFQDGGLSNITNIHRDYLAASVSGKAWSNRRLRSLLTQHRRCTSAGDVIQRCMDLSLVRRARACASAAAAERGAAARGRAAADCICTDVTNEAQVAIEDRLLHIVGVRPPPTVPKKAPKIDIIVPNSVETMLERANCSSPTPVYHSSQFEIPPFLTHTNCQCCQCVNPACVSLVCQSYGLKASVYFRTGDELSAEEFFDGSFKIIEIGKAKLNDVFDGYIKIGVEKYLVELIRDMYRKELLKISAKICIEASYFELSRNNFDKADEYVVRVHEIFEECNETDEYLKHEVLNLMCASANIRKVEIKRPETGLELEMESLRLSPQPQEIPKTPEMKAKNPPKITKPKIVVCEDEVPNTKRKVIKLNLEDTEEPVVEKRVTRKRSEIPVPVTSKPVLEDMTPRPRRKPRVLGTENKR